MIFDVKFRYTLEITRYRKRNSEAVRISDSVPVEVRSATSREAPVAFRFQGEERSPWEGKAIELRSFGGSLWQPVSSVEYDSKRGQTATLLSANDLQAKLARSDLASGTPFALEGTYHDHKRSTTLEEIGRCKIAGDGEQIRAAAIRELHALASEILIVDGIVHEPADEPVYAIKTFGHGDEYGDIEIGFASSVNHEVSPSKVFRADQPEAALAAAIAMDFKSPVTELPNDKRIEVLMPELVTFRYDMGPRLEARATSICQSMAGDLKEADLPFAAGYIRLRDALAAKDQATVAAMVMTDIIPLLEAKSARIGFGSWAEQTARELRDEWQRFGDGPVDELAPLAG